MCIVILKHFLFKEADVSSEDELVERNEDQPHVENTPEDDPQQPRRKTTTGIIQLLKLCLLHNTNILKKYYIKTNEKSTYF